MTDEAKTDPPQPQPCLIGKDSVTETMERARLILRFIWGGSSVLSQHDADWLDANEQPMETRLDTCQRLAGDTYNWRGQPDLKKRARYFGSC